MSVIVPVEAHLETLRQYVDRNARGELDDLGLAMLTQRLALKIQRACWCRLDVCCEVHDEHTSPHRNCIMR